jgi:hypothetical protein
VLPAVPTLGTPIASCPCPPSLHALLLEAYTITMQTAWWRQADCRSLVPICVVADACIGMVYRFASALCTIASFRSCRLHLLPFPSKSLRAVFLVHTLFDLELQLRVHSCYINPLCLGLDPRICVQKKKKKKKQIDQP